MVALGGECAHHKKRSLVGMRRGKILGTDNKKYMEISPKSLSNQCSGNEVTRVIQERGTGRNPRDDRRDDHSYGGGRNRGGGYSDKKPRSAGGGSGRSVKVRGLPYSTSEAELSDFFNLYNVSCG